MLAVVASTAAPVTVSQVQAQLPGDPAYTTVMSTLARLAQKQADLLGVPVVQGMTKSPKTADADELAGACVGRMEQFGIIAMPVTAGDKLVGVVHLHDLLRAGAV